MKRTFFLLIVLILSCSNEKYKLKERENLKVFLERYYKFLSLAYSKDDAKILWPVALDHEIVQTEKTMAKMRGEGYHLDPYLLSFEITYFDLYQYNNAILKTKEVWALSYYDFKTKEKKEEIPNQTLNVTYQLKKINGNWKVLSRIPQETMIKVIQ